MKGDDRTALRRHPVFILAGVDKPLDQARSAVIVALTPETAGREILGIRRELVKTDRTFPRFRFHGYCLVSECGCQQRGAMFETEG
jgi:hypothetical protein